VLVQALLATLAPAQTPELTTEPWRTAYTQRAWTVNDGLPPGIISDVVETRDGYLWLATYGGLVRFDGLRFTLIDSTTIPSLASNQISAIAPAADGGLWVAPVGANVFRTDGRQQLQVLPPRPNAHQFVRRLRMGPDGALWVVADTAVERFSGGAWTDLTPGPRTARQFRTLLLDDAGVAWFGASDGLFRMGPGDRLPARVRGLRAGTDVRALADAHHGQIWIGGSIGLDVLAREGTLRRVSGIPGPVRGVAVDAGGAVWASTPAGVHLVEAADATAPAVSRAFVPAETFGGGEVDQFLLARSGAMVAATAAHGFHVFTRRVVELLGESAGLPGSRVHHLASDGADGLWVGTGCGGLTHIGLGARRSIESYGPPSMGLQSWCVRGLLRDRRGNVWVGQAGGALTRISASGAVRTWTADDGLPRAELGPLLEDRDGRLWVGSRRGALCLIERDGRIHCPTSLAGAAGEKIWSLAEDTDGSVWIGQVGRLTRITPTHDVRSWGTADGLPPSPIRALQPRPGQTIWMATYGGGLARLQGGRIARVGAAQGLLDTALSAIVTDTSGTVWLLGNRGVSITHWTELDAAADGAAPAVDVATYGSADGVPEGNSGHPSATVMPDGRIGFATVEGLAVFDPRRRPTTSPLVPRLDDVRGASPASTGATRFVVPPGGGAVAFGVTAPFIGAPGSVRVRHRLQGRDDTWVEAGVDRRIVYDNLPPGEYALALSARHADGAWSAPVTAATLAVQPLWWQTRATRGLAVVTLALGLAGGVYTRRHAAQRRGRELAREIQDRKTAEEAAHRHLLALARVGRVATAGELAASLAHELGQPLTAIVANAEASRMLLASPAHDPERVAGILGSIAQQGQRASDVIRGLRAFLTRDAPEFAPVDLDAAVREVMPLLESSRVTARAHVTLDLAADLPAVAGDRVPLQQVVLNLTLNALEAVRDLDDDRRCVRVRTRRRGRHVCVTVADSGPGLTAGAALSLFEPLFTTKTGGMGMGLAISRSIVEAHGGRIRARNRRAGGAVFSVRLPIDRASGGRAG
jgi:signal transduction histidine kinase/ligand-binding sensor domain-containing protein